VIYTFNDISLNTVNYQLIKNNEVTSIEPQVFNIIIFLVENNDKVVSRQELLDTIWNDKIVSDSSISNHIKSARKVLDDDGIKQSVIKTVHGRGYQFIAKIEENKVSLSTQEPNKQLITAIKIILILTSLVLMGILWFYRPTPADKSINNTNMTSIAVLAFKDLSPLSDQEYFSDGISEELLNVFTKIPNLKVASRTSSFSFKNKSLTIKKIGKELNVDYVMEGSVRKAGNKLRITAQLIRINDASHIWSETYDHTMDDIFKIQDSIAAEVTKKLKVNLNQNSFKDTPASSQAYTLYLQAVYLLKENTESSIRKSLKLIGKSISLDPNYARAWTVYSRILYTVAIYSRKKDNTTTLSLAKHAVEKALELDANYATAYAHMVLINLAERDMEAAQFNIDKAMQLNNKSSTVVGIAAYHLQITGQLAKDVKMLENAIELDPLYNIHYLNLGFVYLMLNQLEEAHDAIEKYAFFQPDAVAQHALMSHTLIAMGKYEEALIEAEKEVNEFYKLGALGFATFALGDYERADEILDQFLTNYPNSYGDIASFYAFRNDPDNAFKYLEMIYENEGRGLLYIINFQPLRKLWSDPRWDVFINKIGLEEGHWLLEKRLDG
jgi:adenylate cyclase